MRHGYLTIALMLAGLTGAVSAQTHKEAGQESAQAGRYDAVRKAARDGQLLYLLTEPSDVLQLLGRPDEEKSDRDGGMHMRHLRYGDMEFVFGCHGTDAGPFGLLGVGTPDGPIDIGRNAQIVLRNEQDLKKLNSFSGFENVSLADLDLTAHGELVRSMPFDTRTKWPDVERLPNGFDPEATLETGKNPGLGIRALHKQGVDGRGIHVAIIDQPLLLDHVEYASQIEKYEAMGVDGIPPQMHGPPVASILVGRTCGVAPAARLTYFAMPMWERDNTPYCRAIEAILRRNISVPSSERIRVVSISTGMFPHQEHFKRWQRTLEKARSQDLLVVTCDQQWLRYGTLKRKGTADPDDAKSYRPGKYRSGKDALLVPAGGRTTACKHGPQVYEYWPDGGLSWATPYLAGLAALAWQVNPELKSDEIVQLWLDTSRPGEGGPMPNPPAFIAAARAKRP